MPKLNKRFVDSTESRQTDYVVWDDDLPGFGIRVFASGKRSYVIQYRAGGRSRRFTIGLHGIWTAETARREAKAQLGKIAQGENPAEQKQFDHNAMTVKELCDQYVADMEAGLILGKGGTPKKRSTIGTDIGRINGHIIPLLGRKRVRDLTRADITKAMNDIITGKTRRTKKTGNLRGKSVLRGGRGTASRTVGLLGAMLGYAIDAGVITTNVAHGVKKPKDQVRDRRLTPAEYAILGKILRDARSDTKFAMAADIVRQLALTGCRRGEIIGLKWSDVDLDDSCLRLATTKEGASIRPIGLPVVEFLEKRSNTRVGSSVFPGRRSEDGPIGNFPALWKQLLADTSLADVTPHIFRHSFASIANDLGFTEITIAALVGHAKGSVTSKYVHTLDTALIMAADTIAGYIDGLLDGIEFKQTGYALDRASRKAALDQFLRAAAGDDGARRLAA